MLDYRKSIFIALSLVAHSLFAQHEGDQWVFGYNYNPIGDPYYDPNYALMSFDFREEPPVFHIYRDKFMYIATTAASICSKTGDPLLWTNGMEVMANTGQIIIDTLANGNGKYWQNYNRNRGPGGFPKLEGALILPRPGEEDTYSIIHHDAVWNNEWFFPQTNQWLESLVRVSGSDFFVLDKNRSIGEILEWNIGYKSSILGTRHANGRDWWIVAFRGSRPEDGGSNLYDVFLLDPNGLNHVRTDSTSLVVPQGGGQSTISFGGNYVARVDAVWSNSPMTVTVYSFDRCDGSLLVLDTMEVEGNAWAGVAFSPSERFLYTSSHFEIWQFDLWAEDISSSRILVDTFDWYIEPGWLTVPFGPMIEALDGRIYMSSSAGSSKHFNVIQRPDELGYECQFEQHQLKLPCWNARSDPNIANFRLGPIDGSSCDTLGIDNFPVALWRYELQNIYDPSSVRFTDLSYFGPEQWHWDFGDGIKSTEQHPIHTFEASGSYLVCLTVSNMFATDSSCQWVDVLLTDIKDNFAAPDLTCSPNPFSDYFDIRVANETQLAERLSLFNMHGQVILSLDNVPIPARIHTGDLPGGVYTCVIDGSSGLSRSFKLIKL